MINKRLKKFKYSSKSLLLLALLINIKHETKIKTLKS